MSTVHRLDCTFTEMLALLVLLPLAFAAPPSAHIVNGDVVDSVTRHPWQGALLYRTGLTCGCVLLTPDFVLTAGHCTHGRDDNMDLFSMRFNSLEHSNGGMEYNLQKITIHPDYDSEVGFTDNDVCILEPATSITVGTGVDIDSNEYTNDCWISGWGVTSSGIGGSISDVLLEADMDILSSALCESEYGVSHREDVHICIVDNATPHQQGSCNGDSGGPLVCNHSNGPELRGVTSWGINGCSPSYPSVYARLYNSGSGTNLKDWICLNAPGAGGC